MSASRTDVTRGPLGSSGLEITRVGLGAWAIGGGGWQGGWGAQEDAVSIATIRRAVDLGIDWVDTAPAYGFGRAERVVGEALRGLGSGERPLVFTKCGLVWEDTADGVRNDLSPASIRRECEDSLRRLGVEQLDLLQAHWPTWEGTPLEESWATMADLVTEGKVRHIGLSNFSIEDLSTCEAIRHVDTFQPQLSLLVRDAAAHALRWCDEHGTGVIVYSPMRSGLLSGRFDAARVAGLPDDDWRKQCDDFIEPKLSSNLELIARLDAVARRLGATLAELSIAWTLAWRGVSGAIVGARSPGQLDDWIGAAGLSLDEDDLDEIAQILAEVGAGSGPVRPGAEGA